MGGNMSKSEGECVYSTPKRLPPEELVITVNPEEVESNPDPRSPHVCRTPIDKVLRASGDPDNQNMEMIRIFSPHEFENPSTLLRNKLVRELQFNLNDPRSPSQFIDRTPIVFEDSDLNESKSAANSSLDEKFSDLFIECAGEKPVQEDAEIEECDPRSPSIGVERTPIVLTDEAETFESLLEALTLSKKVSNKQVQRLQNTKRPRPGAKTIYEDMAPVFSTPKKAGGPYPKRAPLSCVANKTHLRSRSVENKSKRPKLPLTSYDDNAIKSLKVEALVDSRGNAENAF